MAGMAMGTALLGVELLKTFTSPWAVAATGVTVALFAVALISGAALPDICDQFKITVQHSADSSTAVGVGASQGPALQVMRGHNPDGSAYADPVHWINYFNGSDAVHGFARASYGFPQSVGCAELPIPTAATLWPMVHIGTLVTVLP